LAFLAKSKNNPISFSDLVSGAVLTSVFPFRFFIIRFRLIFLALPESQWE